MILGRIVWLVVGMFGFSSAYGFQIDSMLKVANSDENNVRFTVTNTGNDTLYLNTVISKLTVKDGELDTTLYTRDNFEDWQTSVAPAQSIVEPGHERDFRFERLCGELCGSQDMVYKLSFIPAHSANMVDSSDSHVQFTFGFAPIVIFPGDEAPLNYSIRYVDKEIIVENKGDSFFYVKLMECGEHVSPELCQLNATLLGGRRMSLSLPSGIDSESLEIELYTHTAKYREQILLQRELEQR